jgi:hypothetical protein
MAYASNKSLHSLYLTCFVEFSNIISEQNEFDSVFIVPLWNLPITDWLGAVVAYGERVLAQCWFKCQLNWIILSFLPDASLMSNVIEDKSSWVDMSLRREHTVTWLVEALWYKPEGREFDSRWGHWILFSIYLILPALGFIQHVTEISTRRYFWG